MISEEASIALLEGDCSPVPIRLPHAFPRRRIPELTLNVVSSPRLLYALVFPLYPHPSHGLI